MVEEFHTHPDAFYRPNAVSRDRLLNRWELPTVVEERRDGWLLDEESGRLILVYPQDIEQIDRCDPAAE